MYTNFFDDKIKTYRHTNTHTHASIIHGSLSLYEKKEKKKFLQQAKKKHNITMTMTIYWLITREKKT